MVTSPSASVVVMVPSCSSSSSSIMNRPDAVFDPGAVDDEAVDDEAVDDVVEDSGEELVEGEGAGEESEDQQDSSSHPS
jgi:hypothetical protein